MIETYVRQTYQRYFVNPLAKRIGVHITPIHLSLLAGIFGILFVPVYAYWQLTWLAIVLLVLSGFLDTLDGTLARFRGLASPLGSVVDIMVDRLVESCVLLGLFLVAPDARGLFIVLMLITTLLCISSFLVVGIFTANDSNKSFHYSPGLIERAEAFLFFVLMVLLPSWFSVLAIIYCVLVLLTAIIRIGQFYHIYQQTNVQCVVEQRIKS